MNAAESQSVEELVDALRLEAHPEGGWYARVFTHPDSDPDGRPLATGIHYLLGAGDRSQWHRIDAVEVWHHHAGAPMEIAISEDGVTTSTHLLGTDVGAGQVPTVIVPAHAWQCAAPVSDIPGGWSLVGCTVTPGFRFEGFELALPCWEPGFDR